MTRRPALKAQEYRRLAAEEAELAKSAVSNETRARHCAMADYYTRLAEAQERLPRTQSQQLGSRLMIEEDKPPASKSRDDRGRHG
jgi:hypothetical protein